MADSNNPSPPSAIMDTIPAPLAIRCPEKVLDHCAQQTELVWLSDRSMGFAEDFLRDISRSNRAVWGTIIGPFGFGKTATAFALTRKFIGAGYLSLPPLSATNLDQYAAAACSLLRVVVPEVSLKVDKAWEAVYAKPPKPKKRAHTEGGRNGQAHRLVAFLSSLTSAGGPIERGLILQLDELQQVLGMLDTAALASFREFVWGLRTEHARCGMILLLDTVLVSRLERWAADIMHRIHENGHTLRLEEAYDRRFPMWLWPRWSAVYCRENGATDLDPDLLLSLGQFVERWDLANGPRTVVEVFSRALEFGIANYGLDPFVRDLTQGRFRYFADGTGIEKVLNSVLADRWIREDPARERLVKLLAAYPEGCPEPVLTRYLPNSEERQKVTAEMFGPLLVNGKAGLALEATQRVRRPFTHLEDVLQCSWHTLPAYNALLERMPEMIEEAILPIIFHERAGRHIGWAIADTIETKILTGWRRYHGTFDEDFPDRHMAVFVGVNPPSQWPADVDFAIAFIVVGEFGEDLQPELATLSVDTNGAHLLVKMPALHPIGVNLPAEIEKYRKFLDPEPFRPANLLAAVVELNRLPDQEGITEATRLRGQAFSANATEIVLRSLINGTIQIRPGLEVKLSALDLVRALFSQAMRLRYPHYVPLARFAGWREALRSYRQALADPRLSAAQRRGDEAVEGTKGDLYAQLFKQTSTAAGDSFVRSLGPLVQLEEKGRRAVIRLTSHLAEITLLDSIRSGSRERGDGTECIPVLGSEERGSGQRGPRFGSEEGHVPVMSAMDTLIRHGWTEEEAKEAVALSCARGVLGQSDDVLYTLMPDASILGQNAESQTANIANIALAGQIASAPETPSEQQMPEPDGLMEFAALKDRLFDQIGAVRAAEVASVWPDSDIAIHLRGIGLELSHHQKSLLTGGRKLTAKLSNNDNAERPPKPRYLLKEIENLAERVSLFERRTTALRSWHLINDRLRALRAAVVRISESSQTGKIMADEFENLAGALRERFSTERWSPLDEAEVWDEKIWRLEQRIQGLQYDGLMAFLRRRQKLIQWVGWAADGPAPEWVEPLQTSSLLFDALTKWGVRAIERGLALLKCLDNVWAWRDPANTKISYSELRRRCERALATVHADPSDDKVDTAADLLARLFHGFNDPIVTQKIYRTLTALRTFNR
jgi:hypothetical protein